MKSEVGNLQLFWLSGLSAAHTLGSVAFLIAAPQFRSLYADFSVSPPAITDAIASSPERVWWLFVVLGSIQLVLFIALAIKRTSNWRRMFLVVGAPISFWS